MNHHKQAFTLIELLVVVLIIGILAAVAVPKYTRAVDKAKYTQVMVLGEKILDAGQRFFMENGYYTKAISDLDIDMPTPIQVRTTDWETYIYDWGECGIHSTGYMYCKLKVGTNGVWYFGYFDIPGRQCWAFPQNNTRGHELCKAMTGKTDIVPSSFYTQYPF